MANSRVHELKSHPWYFEAVREGTKRFEMRINDRDFNVGDVLWLKEWRPADKVYTGRELKVRVTYMTTDAGFLVDGIVALGFDRLDATPDEQKAEVKRLEESMRLGKQLAG